MKNKKITSGTSTAGKAQQRLRIAAALLGIGGLILAVLLGIYVSAVGTVSKTFVGETTDTINLFQQSKTLPQGQYTAFNWFIFLLAYAPCLISSAILLSGSEVCGAVARRTRTRSGSSSAESEGGTGL